VENIARKEETVVGLFQSEVIFDFESQNIFPKWVIFVVSYILVSLSDNLLIF
jgi:hypothetical protein